MIGEVTTWWLEGTKVINTNRPEQSMLQNSMNMDSYLHVPGSSDTISSRHSSVTSDYGVDLLKLPTMSICRPRSNSIKSYSSIRSATAFKRAGSFRQRIKHTSLSTPYVSIENVNGLSSHKSPVNITPTDESMQLLKSGNYTSSTDVNKNSIVTIQIDQY